MDHGRFDRRFYTWADLGESVGGMAMIDRLEGMMNRLLHQRYGHLNEDELLTILTTMNASNTDLAHYFCYDEYLGGLAHIQWSYLEGEDFFLMSPVRPGERVPRPISRVCTRSNGIVCTLAPADVSAMYRVAMENGTIRLTYQPFPFNAMETSAVCAYCFARADSLLHCTCGMVRYCNRRCQRAHWRDKHKLSCRWVISCMRAFGPAQPDE